MPASYPVTANVQSSFLDRTLRGAWRAIAAMARGKTAEPVRPDLPEEDMQRLVGQINDCLEAKGGEVSARARAARLGRTYLSLNAAGRKRFLGVLAARFNVEPAPVDEAIAAVQSAADAEERQRAERALREALRPPRFILYKQFTALPEGVKFLVDLRAELIRLGREDPVFKVPEAELKSLLASWFDVGFLELARIEWDSPASVLEKLIEYEAVHRIDGWDDLKNRLGSDRRCFAFFHPRMPREPLIFVEVALVSGTSDNIQTLLDKDAPVIDPIDSNTAIFYSISNAQRGLAGISFGDFLIKRVVDLLAVEFKGLKAFSTLSPVPGFSGWLEEKLEREQPQTEIFLPAERKKLGKLASDLGDAATLKALLLEPDWHGNAQVSAALRGPMLRLCARYLLGEKRGERFARNAVAHFHLSNGASIERINWLADTSPNGMAQSGGIMVNYRYDRGEIEDNHEAYRGEGSIKASASVKSLMRAKR